MSASSPIIRPVRVLLDTNVILDLLLRRDPWYTQAQSFWQARDAGQMITFLPTSSITDLYYIGVRQVGRAAARQGIEWCLQEMGMIPVTRVILQTALALAGSDFEDDVVIACAQRGQCQFIATRDGTGFHNSPVPALEPLSIAVLLTSTP